MSDYSTKHLVVTEGANRSPHMIPEKIALFDAAGNRLRIPSEEELSGRFGALSVQGTYARSRPLNGSDTIRPLLVNPLNTSTLWAFSGTTIGLWNGTAYTSRASSPNTGLSCFQLLQTSTHLFALMGSGADRSGQIWRSPAPAADGTGITWSKVWDMATDGAGVNAYWRNGCLAANGSTIFALEYGDTITGGPSLWRSTSNGNSGSWTKQFTWTQGKHGHSVMIVDGVPLVVIGDAGFRDTGTWIGNAAGTSWNRKHSWYPYAIRVLDTEIAGARVLVGENDTQLHGGPLVSFEATAGGLVPTSGTRPWIIAHSTPGLRGTMRSLTELPDGQGFIYVVTGERGPVGPVDAIVQCDARLQRPIVLETFDAATGALRNELLLDAVVEQGGQVWFGTYRITPETYTLPDIDIEGTGYVIPDMEVSGDLTGTLSNALIGTGKVDTPRLADGAVTSAKLSATLAAARQGFGSLGNLGGDAVTALAGGDRVSIGTVPTLPVNQASLVIGWSNTVAGTLAGDLLLVPRTSAARRTRLYGTDSTAAVEALNAGASGANPVLGFFGSAGGTKPTVTGSRGGNAALASLLTALATLGLITDSTTA